jgi:3-oxoacyl-[acyl-carrier-protein] synthase II
MARRVVITGLGVITSLGEQVDTMWDALIAGKSGITAITRIKVDDFPVRIGGECPTFDVSKYGVDVREARRLDRFAAFGIAASVSAVKDAGIDFTKEDPYRCGVIIGTGIGGIETIEESCNTLTSRGYSRLSPFTVPRMMANAASGNVSITFGLRGPNTAVATACATGSNAIGDAGRLIQHGYADVMVAGGSEAALCRLGLSSFIAARAVSQRNDDPGRASRPWDKNRDGFVMGEGAGVMILEEYEHAKARGARIYAELVGYGMSADAHHITAPVEQGTGAAKSMQLALADAKLNPNDIDYINADAKKVAISSTKSHLGHLLGASGGVEAVVSVLSVYRNLIPPTINLDEPDEECDLDFVPHKARELKVTHAMSNSFGFGGHNATLIVKKM